MSNIYLGAAVNFGTGSTVITDTDNTNTTIGTLIIQGVEHGNKAKVEDTQDGNGNTVQRTVYDPMTEATFEAVIKGTGQADAITQTKCPPIGTLLKVADTADAAIASSYWIVADGSSIKRSNKGNAMLSLKLEKFPGITSVTAA